MSTGNGSTGYTHKAAFVQRDAPGKVAARGNVNEISQYAVMIHCRPCVDNHMPPDDCSWLNHSASEDDRACSNFNGLGHISPRMHYTHPIHIWHALYNLFTGKIISNRDNAIMTGVKGSLGYQAPNLNPKDLLPFLSRIIVKDSPYTIAGCLESTKHNFGVSTRPDYNNRALVQNLISP